MIWRPQDDGKVAMTDLVCHRVVYIPAVKGGQIIPNLNVMQVGAGDMARLDIPSEVVAEVAKDIICGSNGAYTFNPTSRAINAPSNM